MTLGGWRWASASAIGTSHQKDSSPCQDAHKCATVIDGSGQEVLVCIVSDGAGSAPRGGEGAEIVCEILCQFLSSWLQSGKKATDLSKSVISLGMDTFRQDIGLLAVSESRPFRDYSCTCLGAIVGENYSAFFQIGDGCIVIRPADDVEFQWVFWPERGEYENTTYFATGDDWIKHIQFDSALGSVAEIALFTDGLQRLALDLGLQIPHQGFFKPVFKPLQCLMAGFSEELSKSLAAFLDSERVNGRTDDDKTLVLASRIF